MLKISEGIAQDNGIDFNPRAVLSLSDNGDWMGNFLGNLYVSTFGFPDKSELENGWRMSPEIIKSRIIAKYPELESVRVPDPWYKFRPVGSYLCVDSLYDIVAGFNEYDICEWLYNPFAKRAEIFANLGY